MKKLFITLMAIVFVTACATIPIQNPVCPQEGSWICEKSAELGVQPEQVYDWIYDAAVIAAVTDIAEIKDICEFEQRIADWYVKVYPMSYDTFIYEVLAKLATLDQQKYLLIKNIINKNFVFYFNPELISPADNIIFRKGHVQFRRDMLCY